MSTVPRSHEDIIRHFVLKEQGAIHVVTRDQTFVKNFRALCQKHMALPPESLSVYTETGKALKELELVIARGARCMVLVERELDGVPTGDFIRALADQALVTLVLLTGEIERDRLILLHEMGVKSCITKPISANGLLEKLANVLRPPSKLGELMDKGREFIAAGEFPKALLLAEKVLEIKPGSPAGLMLKADALKAMGRMDDAREALEQAAGQSDLYIEPLKKLADFYGEVGDEDHQLRILEKLDQLSPLNVERKVSIGGLALKRGEPDRAKALFDNAVKMTTRHAMGLVSNIFRTIAESCLKDSPELAEEYLRGGLLAKGDMLDAGDIETFNQLGIALRKQGKWQEALTEYHKALKLAPDDENLIYNCAMALMEGKRFSDSARELDKALTVNPAFGQRNASVLCNAAQIYLLGGNPRLAAQFVGQCLERWPDHPRGLELQKKLSE